MSYRDTAAEHNIRHLKAPERWEHGFPLGNGEVGVMFWGGGAPLAFTLDKADLWDLRTDTSYMDHPDYSYDGLVRLVSEGRFSEVDEVFEQNQRKCNPVGPTKISIGRAELHIGRAEEYDCRLDLGTAKVKGTIRTSVGEHGVRAFVHHDRNLFCLQVTDPPADTRLDLRPLAGMNDSLARLSHPEPRLTEDGDIRVLLQEIPEWTFCAAAWNISGPDYFLAVETGATWGEAVSRARETWQRARDAGFEKLLREHEESWRRFWAASAIYLPEREIEFLWYYGLYLLGSSARQGSIPPGLQGIWAMDGVLPPWRGDYHADMNVQETFWPACASGHLDLLDSWCDLMKDCLPNVQAHTRRFFGTEGTFWTCAFLPKYTVVPGWHTVQLAWSNTGWLAWLVWLRWRYSIDREWLRETGYPLVAEAFKFYRANLREEEDGRLHIPVSSSPEYKENKPAAWCKDPNIDIALIRRCCDWLVEMEEALGMDELAASAREVQHKLAPYHLTDEKVLCLWAGKPLDESHRHPSHLMAVHPAIDITIDDGEEPRAIIDASLEQYFSLGRHLWGGHTYAQLASFGAVIGRPEFAYDCLRNFREYWIGPNGLHFNRDLRETGNSHYYGGNLAFTMEANCGVAAGICDMLVQGWNDIVRVFPAVPKHWRDAAFKGLLTEGAFRVSAVRRQGRTVWVRVVAGVNRQLRLRNPFGEAQFETVEGELRREGDLLVADLRAGEEIQVFLKGESIDFAKQAMLARHGDTSRLGLRQAPDD